VPKTALPADTIPSVAEHSNNLQHIARDHQGKARTGQEESLAQIQAADASKVSICGVQRSMQVHERQRNRQIRFRNLSYRCCRHWQKCRCHP